MISQFFKNPLVSAGGFLIESRGVVLPQRPGPDIFVRNWCETVKKVSVKGSNHLVIFGKSVYTLLWLHLDLRSALSVAAGFGMGNVFWYFYIQIGGNNHE